MPTLSVGELRAFTLDVLEKLGTPPNFAEIVCNNLVGANLARGVAADHLYAVCA
jgi:LDH2 family malate/lactate/ureidoglycolate dehydrogenase